MTSIVITRDGDTVLMHVEGDSVSLVTGGDGLGHDGYRLTSEPTPQSPEAVDAFRAAAAASPDLFAIRED